MNTRISRKVWLTGLFLLNVALRLPVIGHFLTSDEALTKPQRGDPGVALHGHRA